MTHKVNCLYSVFDENCFYSATLIQIWVHLIVSVNLSIYNLKYLHFMATSEVLGLLNCWSIMCLIKDISLLAQLLTWFLVCWIAGIVWHFGLIF
jgi:hypothetical protein